MTASLLFALTLLCYFISAVCYHAHLFADSERARKLAPIFAGVGWVVHTLAIGARCTEPNHTPIVRDPAMAFSLAAYFIAALQVSLEVLRRWASPGSLAMPLAFVAQSYASLRMTGPVVAREPAGRLLSPHVMALVLGFAAFALAFCLAVIYLIQSRLLKTKQVRGIFKRLPPLESVATSAHWLAAIGFSMLTLGIITGTLAAPQTWGPEWYLDPHTITGVVAWVIYAGYLGTSILLGWHGRRRTYFLIVGFLVVVGAFFVSASRPRSAPSALRPAFAVPGPADVHRNRSLAS